MSLEDRIQSLEVAIVNLTSVLQNKQPTVIGAAIEQKTATVPVAKPRGRPPSPPKEEISVVDAARAIVGTKDDPANIDFQRDVLPLGLKVIELCGREEQVSNNQRMGVVKLSDLKPGQWPSMIQLMNDSIKKKQAADAQEAQDLAAVADDDPI